MWLWASDLIWPLVFLIVEEDDNCLKHRIFMKTNLRAVWRVFDTVIGAVIFQWMVAITAINFPPNWIFVFFYYFIDGIRLS